MESLIDHTPRSLHWSAAGGNIFYHANRGGFKKKCDVLSTRKNQSALIPEPTSKPRQAPCQCGMPVPDDRLIPYK